VFPVCMVDSVPIIPCGLDGVPKDAGPYYLGIDTEICTHWGVDMTPGEYLKCGIDPKYGHYAGGPNGWHKPSKPNVVWQEDKWVELAC
jgi:hypothetical protein